MAKPLEILYSSLKRDNYDVPDTYESFEKTLTLPGDAGVKNRQTLYDSLKRDDYDVPDTYESFSHTLFGPVKAATPTTKPAAPAKPAAPTTPAAPAKPATPATPAPSAQVNAEAPAAPAQSPSAAGEVPGAPFPGSISGIVKAAFPDKEDGATRGGAVPYSQIQQDLARMRGQWAQTAQQIHRKTEDFNRAAHATTVEGQREDRLMEQAARSLGIETRLSGLTRVPKGPEADGDAQPQDADQEGELRYQAPLTGPRVAGVKLGPDGKPMAEWRLSDGSVTDNMMLADADAAEARDARLQHEYESDRLTQEKDRLAKLEHELAERKQAVRDADLGTMGNIFVDRSDAANMSTLEQGLDPELSALEVSVKQTRKRVQALENARDSRVHGDGFWRGFRRGLTQTLQDVDGWDFGRGTLKDAATMMHMMWKAEHKKSLSREEQAALGDIFATQSVLDQIGDLGRGYRWGSISGASLQFMKDFVITGGYSSIGKGMATKAARTVAEKAAAKAGKQAAETLGMKVAEDGLLATLRAGGKGTAAKLIEEQGMRGVAQIVASRALGVGATDLLVRSPMMVGTVQLPGTVGETIQKKLGRVVRGADGALRFENDESWGNAMYQTVTDKVIENASEMWGGHLPGASDAARAMGARNLSAWILRATREGAGTKLSMVTKFLNRSGMNGLFGEVAEEYVGQLWRTMPGLMSDDLRLEGAYNAAGLNNFLDSDFHVDIWGGMSLSVGLTGGGAMTAAHVPGAARLIASKVNTLNAQRAADRASERLSELLGADKAMSWHERVVMTENKNLPELMKQIVHDESLSQEEVEAITDLVEKTMIVRGANMRELIEREGTDKDSKLFSGRADAWASGLAATGEEERAAIEEEYASAARELTGYIRDSEGKAIDTWLCERTGADAVGDITSDAIGRLGLSERGMDAVERFIHAQLAYEGMLRGKTEMTRDETEAGYAEGREAAESGGGESVAARMEAAYSGIEEAFGDEYESALYGVTTDPWSMVNNPQLSIDQQDAVLEFIKAKAAMDGMQDATQDIAERRRQEVRQAVESRTHRSSGRIVRATMKAGDRQVYVVQGRVAMYDDGNGVDVNRSSGTIVVQDAQTGEYEFAAPEQIMRTEPEIDAAAELQSAMAKLDAELIGNPAENSVTLPENSPADGNRPEQNNDERAGSRQDDGGSVAGNPAGSVEAARDRSDIRVYEEGLASSRAEHSEHSERDRREAESERLVGRSDGAEAPAPGQKAAGLTEQEAADTVAKMEANAEAAPELELTPENWLAEFGENGSVETPIGRVKMGEHQFMKLFSRKRGAYFGMIRPTLETPDIVLEESDPKDGAERDCKYLFIKTFIKPDRTRIVHFESVTVQKDGMEVSISSHEISDKAMKNKMQNDKILHLAKKLSLSSEMRLTETPGELEGPDLVPSSDSHSASKDSGLPSEKQAGSAESLRNVPTDSQGRPDVLHVEARLCRN